MKICIVATSGISLTNFRGDLIKEWVRLGHNVICVSIEPEETMMKSIGELGADYFQVSGSRTGISPIEGIKMVGLYEEAFKVIRPDICFLYMSKPIAFGGWAAVRTKVPHIFLLANGLENAYYRTGIKDMIVRFVMNHFIKKVGKHSDCVFVQNIAIRDLYSSKKLLKDNKIVVVNGSGVDMEKYKLCPLPDAPVFLMASRLLRSKGVCEYFKAAQIVNEKVPEARFILVGGLDENDEAITKEELDELICTGAVEYRGHTDDVREYIRQCSVFVLPSYHEGISRGVLEAMSMGRPIITTTAHGCDDTVEQGVNGYKIAAKNVEQLAESMLLLAKDKTKRHQMGERSHQICKEKFEVSKVNLTINQHMKLI